MNAPIRAIYKDGQLQLLDPVDLANGEEVSITIQSASLNTEFPLGKRIPELHPGAIWTSDDFDEPLPDSFWLGENTLGLLVI